MINALLSACFTFLFTAVLGTWIANRWQERSARDARFFEASKDIYRQMSTAAESMTSLIGRRIYTSQRIAMMSAADRDYDVALTDFKSAIIEWNIRLMEIELSIKSLFRNTYLSGLEDLQSDLVDITNRLSQHIRSGSSKPAVQINIELRDIRFAFFKFSKEMLDEAKTLHRQIHFGVKINYDRYDIDKWSSYELFKQLFMPYKKDHSIVRSPSDFGVPVPLWDARFGINEH